jgi:serine/threonine protein kinase
VSREGGSSGGPDDEPERPSDWLHRVDEELGRVRSLALTGGDAPYDADALDSDRMRLLLQWIDHALVLDPSGSTLTGDGGSKTLAGHHDDDAPVMPEAIGRFRPEEVLGSGGFGIVFRAFDPEMDRFVALKIPKVDPSLAPEVRRRFLREARAAARLDHPNLVAVFEAGEAGSLCYIASAYCEGPTLRRWIDRGNAPLGPRAAARMALALARATEYMHGKGILHCDLKPGNILLDLPEGPGADPIPRLTDFGLARLAEAPLGASTPANHWGTPPYMAPEQITQEDGGVGPRSDVYALGAVLYELLTGVPPHRAQTLWDLLHAVASEPPVPPSRHLGTIPRDLDAIVAKCLEKRPDRRYGSSKDLADDLQRFLDHLPTLARPLGPIRRSGRWALRHPVAAVSLVTGAL